LFCRHRGTLYLPAEPFRACEQALIYRARQQPPADIGRSAPLWGTRLRFTRLRRTP
jgi:hypothetical protein